MKILITGINGFMGQHLANTLIKKGHEVKGSGDVLDKKLIDKQVSEVDCVVHLAAKTSHKDISENKFETLEINLTGTKNVLDAFVKSKAKKFIYPSSGKVYGKIKSLPISEKDPTIPVNILGKSKLIAERLIDFYSDNDKEFIIFRIFNVYGKNQRKNFLIPTIIEQLDKRKQLLLGDINAKRDYLYIDDLVNAFVLAIEGKGKPGVSIYNVCTGKGSSAKEIVKIISKIKRLDIRLKTNPSLFREDETKEEYGSFKLIQKTFGWKPKIRLEKGLGRLITN